MNMSNTILVQRTEVVTHVQLQFYYYTLNCELCAQIIFDSEKNKFNI